MQWRNNIQLQCTSIVNTDMNIRALAENVLISRAFSQEWIQFIARYKICPLSLSVALIGQNICNPPTFPPASHFTIHVIIIQSS